MKMKKGYSPYSDSVDGGKYYDAGSPHGGKDVKPSLEGSNLKTPRICSGGDMAYKNGGRKGHTKTSRKGTPMVYK